MDKIDRLVKFIREEGAIVNNVGEGKIAGTSQAGDDPPVNKKKKKKRKRTPVGRYGSRRFWLQDLNGK